MSEHALEGKVAIVTGAGRGIGRALALALARAGADVGLAARSAEEIESVAGEVEGLGRRALAVPTDVTREADVERLVGGVVEGLGGLHVMVNNSGVIHASPLAETGLEDWERVVATNLRGTFLCTRAAGRHFLGRGEGKVVNVASNFAFAGVPRFASYCASNAAVLGLTRAAAVEWAPHNVQVNAVAPGYVETDMNAAARNDEKLRDRIFGQVPARRMAKAEELGPLVVYLSSPASNFMTGETIVFDGGQVAK
jgi:NAD(P)-dependent dehydrogenase (short-subunit alcohol dehydrogenase family)